MIRRTTRRRATRKLGKGKAAELRRRLEEALAREAASAEILVSIRSSRESAQPVLDAIVRNLQRLFGTAFAAVFLVRDGKVEIAAAAGKARFVAGMRAGGPMRLEDEELLAVRAMRRAHVLRLCPVVGNPDAPPKTERLARQTGFNSVIAAPMLRDGVAIGSIATARQQAIPFGDEQVALIKSFADQAVIAIENARLFNETREALEQQTATGEILQSIASSVSNVQPVFDAIVRSAARLCNARFIGMYRYDGTLIHFVASHGMEPKAVAALRRRYPQPPEDESLVTLSIRDRRVTQVLDFEAEPQAPRGSRAFARQVGGRSQVVVPLLRDGLPIGAIALLRVEAGPFPESELALLRTFADQAVIAIENARLFNETKEALERQTASSDVLRVIGSSPSNLQPVFDAILENAMRMCDANLATVGLYDGKHYRHVAQRGGSPEYVKFLFDGSFEPGTQYTIGRMIADKQPFHIADYRELPSYKEGNPRSVATAEVGGTRTYLAVPMLKDGNVVGGITVRRTEVRPFTQKQIDLVKTFADQAVIAIENARLFNETKEALERQTATAEILKVIASSPSDTQPVFDAIARSAQQLLAGSSATVARRVDDTLHLAAHTAFSEAGAESLRKLFPAKLTGQAALGRAVLTGKPAWIADVETDPAYSEEFRKGACERGYRSLLAVPMMREGVSIGGITVTRREPGTFSDRQIELLKTFADQAVIAIENVRLFNETKEALEKQTATAEILGVISGTPTDTLPVFEAIVRRATKLCEAVYANVFRYDGDKVHWVCSDGWPPDLLSALQSKYPAKPDRSRIVGRVVLDKQVVRVEDTRSDPDYDRDLAARLRYRRILGVPLLRWGEVAGVITVGWPEPGLIEPRHEELLKTFAAQAVIAIENVRLFNETKEALDQQTAISEVLRVISSSPADVQPVLDVVASRAAGICDATDARIFVVDGESMRHAAGFGDVPVRTGVVPITRASTSGRAVIDRAPVHIADIEAESPEESDQQIQQIARKSGWRSALAVPLMREKRALGAIVLRRKEVQPFTEKQVALLKTFADQAAIAIENVRLFNETREALEQQKATAEVLGVISGSIADTQPVFEKILDSCERLFEGHLVGITVVRADDMLDRAAYRGPHEEEIRSMFPMPLSRDSASGNAILDAQVIHYPDIEASGVPAGAVHRFRLAGTRAIICAPMLFEGRGVGAIWVGRSFAAAFTDKQITLLRTFADQAAIAIQNARLFREIEEKSAQLEVANKHKSEFLANMSHELRTPLNAIIGFSEALSDRMFGEVNEKQAEYLKDIHESGRHLLSLINDILDLSKIEAGRMELDLSTFHLPTALGNAMTLIRERAQRHGIQLELEVDERLGEFTGDERKFKQIMLNLLSNAVKFTPDGGRIAVSATNGADRVEIAVKDTGIGIAPEDQALVFEEFRQVGRDRMRKAEGTGLGLALTKRFVELHGGVIRLESAPGKGSTFTVLLPLR
jgi:GAF domain-containing protein